MAFLKSSQITGLSAKDIDVKGFTQADSINLGDRVYTEHEVLLADAYKIVGNVTVGRLTFGILNLMTGNEKFGNRKLIVGTLIRLKNFFIIANLLFIK